MPTTYTTGTINQPDAGSVGLAMMERIRDDIVAHAAWDLVEEFTPSGGAMRWYVFRCIASASGLPNDFFVIFGRRLSDGMLRMFLAEQYVAGSHSASNFVIYNYYNGVAHDAQGRNPLAYALALADLGGASGQPLTYYWAPGGTSTKWWIIVGDDFFTVAFNGQSNGWMNVGAYTPLSSVPIDMPVQAAGSQGTNGAFGSLTRNPTVANVTCTAAALVFQADVTLGFASDLRYNDKLQGNNRPVSELGMRIYEYNVGDRTIYGNALGKLKHVRTGNGQAPGGMAFGDAYVLEGRLWVPYAPTDARFWDTGVPSS